MKMQNALRPVRHVCRGLLQAAAATGLATGLLLGCSPRIPASRQGPEKEAGPPEADSAPLASDQSIDARVSPKRDSTADEALPESSVRTCQSLTRALLRGRLDATPTGEDQANLLLYRDGVGTLKDVVSAADWAKRRAHILENMQLVMGPVPGPEKCVDLDVQDVKAPTAIGKDQIARYNRAYGQTAMINYAVVRRKITFVAERGDRVPAYLLAPEGLSGKTAGVLCLHHTTNPTTMGKNATAGVEPSVATGLELATRGYVTIVPDYPNFGEYPIDPYKMGYLSASMKAIWNDMRAVDLLQTLPEVDPERIGVIGFSLGGHGAMYAAAFDPRIKAVVSSSGFTSNRKYPGPYTGSDLSNGCNPLYYTPRLCSVYGADPARVPYDFTEVVGALAPRAFFANAPTMDKNFALSGVMDCMNAAAPVYELLGVRANLQVSYPIADHSFLSDARAKAYEFFDRSIGNGGH